MSSTTVTAKAGDPVTRFFAGAGIHYAWVVAFVTFFAALVAAGAIGSVGVMILPLQMEFAWTRAEISSALGLRLALLGLVAPIAAALFIRFGLRPVMVVSLVLIAAGMAATVWMTQLWQLVALWGVTVGLAAGLTTFVMSATVATRWFETRRGLVIGLLSAAQGHGPACLPAPHGLAGAAGWLAHRHACDVCNLYRRRGACCRLYPQPPVGRRPAPLWRRARCAAPGCGARASQPLPRSVGGARCRRAQTDVLDPSRIILRLRRIHQRPGSDAPNPDVWRLHDPRDGRGRHAGADARVQFRRHGRLGVAHRSIQPPRPPTDLLRSARPVAVLPAGVGLRSHSTRRLCGFLRPRLDRHCPADCEAHSRRLRACARHARIRLDLRVPPARGGAGRFHGRPHPHRTRLLHAGVPGRRQTMRGRRPGLRRRAPPRPACFHGGPRYILPQRIACSALAQPRAHAEKLGEPARSGRCPSSISPTRP